PKASSATRCMGPIARRTPRSRLDLISSRRRSSAEAWRPRCSVSPSVAMITSDYVRTMASYNRWQNESLYGAADTLTDAQRKEQRGAFFGSIHGTLNHLLWADQMWMSRFAGTPRPKGKSPADSTAECETWDDLKAARGAFDATIIGWAAALEASWLQGELTWFSGAAGREVTKPKW